MNNEPFVSDEIAVRFSEHKLFLTFDREKTVCCFSPDSLRELRLLREVAATLSEVTHKPVIIGGRHFDTDRVRSSEFMRVVQEEVERGENALVNMIVGS